MKIIDNLVNILRRTPRKKIEKRLKRIVDILEKLGVASLAVGIFQNKQIGIWIGVVCIIASVLLTTEDI